MGGDEVRLWIRRNREAWLGLPRRMRRAEAWLLGTLVWSFAVQLAAVSLTISVRPLPIWFIRGWPWAIWINLILILLAAVRLDLIAGALPRWNRSPRPGLRGWITRPIDALPGAGLSAAVIAAQYVRPRLSGSVVLGTAILIIALLSVLAAARLVARVRATHQTLNAFGGGSRKPPFWFRPWCVVLLWLLLMAAGVLSPAIDDTDPISWVPIDVVRRVMVSAEFFTVPIWIFAIRGARKTLKRWLDG